MRRREFIALLGGGIIWPLAADAQQKGAGLQQPSRSADQNNPVLR
jgi:hypothetical protein